MTGADVVCRYQAEIAALDMAIGAANNWRTALETLERQTG